MKFEPLRRLRELYFGPRATSVSPVFEPKPTLTVGTSFYGSIRYDGRIELIPPSPYVDPHQRGAEPEPIGSTMVRVLPRETPNDAMQRFFDGGGRPEDLPGWNDRRIAADPPPRPGIEPPSDPAIEGWTWTAWKREFDAGSLPGWAMCRFANRIGPDHAAFVFGIVRGSFGIWRQPFGVCRQGAEPHHEEILSCVTHLRSGLGIGIFADREVAAAAAELADSVCPSWAIIEPDDRTAWRDVQHRTVMAWQGVGIYVAADAHCHDEAGGNTFNIFHRSTETIMHGRPEKLS